MSDQQKTNQRRTTVVKTTPEDIIVVESTFVAQYMSEIDDLTDADFIRMGRAVYRRALKERARRLEEA